MALTNTAIYLHYAVYVLLQLLPAMLIEIIHGP